MHGAALSNSKQHPESRSGPESLNRTPVACRRRVGAPGSRLPVCAHGSPESGLWPPLLAGAGLCPHLRAASTLLLLASSTGLRAQLLHPWAWQSGIRSTDLSFLPVSLLGARFQCKQPLFIRSPSRLFQRAVRLQPIRYLPCAFAPRMHLLSVSVPLQGAQGTLLAPRQAGLGGPNLVTYPRQCLYENSN